jgi:hypothetical protein
MIPLLWINLVLYVGNNSWISIMPLITFRDFPGVVALYLIA